MTIRVPQPANTQVAIQRCGYARFVDPRTGEESFVRRMGTGFYPRFHLYVEEHGHELVLSLHLDQKKPSYPSTKLGAGGGWHAHSGEYEGLTVEREAGRITGLLSSLPPPPTPPPRGGEVKHAW